MQRLGSIYDIPFVTFVRLPLDCRAADLEAGAATGAFFRIHRIERPALENAFPFDQNAGLVGNNHRRFGALHFLLEGLLGLLQVKGIHHPDMLDPQSPAELGNIDPMGRLRSSGYTGSGVVLAAGHGGDAVVENNHGCRRIVVDHVHQAVDAGVEEGGIADHGHHLLSFLLGNHLYHPGGVADGGAHADTGFHGGQGRQETEGITADIAGNIGLEVVEGIEDTPVGTAGTHVGRPAGKSRCRCLFFVRG